jgi:hypothetical protein
MTLNTGAAWPLSTSADPVLDGVDPSFGVGEDLSVPSVTVSTPRLYGWRSWTPLPRSSTSAYDRPDDR